MKAFGEDRLIWAATGPSWARRRRREGDRHRRRISEGARPRGARQGDVQERPDLLPAALSRHGHHMAATTSEASPSLPPAAATGLRDLTPQQWKSGVAAWLGWTFDGLDMHLYTLVYAQFVAQLLAVSSTRDPAVGRYASIIQGGFLLGWALGGGFFGRMGTCSGEAARSRSPCSPMPSSPGCPASRTPGGTCSSSDSSRRSGSEASGRWVRRFWLPNRAGSSSSGCCRPSSSSGSGAPFRAGRMARGQGKGARQRAQDTRSVQGTGAARHLLVILVCALSLTAHWAFMFWHQIQFKNLPDVIDQSAAAKNAWGTKLLFLIMVSSIAGNFLAAVLAQWMGYRKAIALMCLGYLLSMAGAYGTARSHTELYFWLVLPGLFQGVFALFSMYLPPLFRRSSARPARASATTSVGSSRRQASSSSPVPTGGRLPSNAALRGFSVPAGGGVRPPLARSQGWARSAGRAGRVSSRSQAFRLRRRVTSHKL